MPHVVEPGTRLVQRYRLEVQLAGGEQAVGGQVAGTTYWRAHDELLERPVGVCLLPAGDETAERVLGAARTAATLSDPRFLRVLDASEVDGVVYVVTEWISATNLVDLLADGPLPPYEAQALAGDIAGALAAAHQAGLPHLCLEPEHVLRTPHGQLKLAGLGVEAAARGIVLDDPTEAARRDTRGAASVLYASLTLRWPGAGDSRLPEAAGDSRLPEAPRDGIELCSPRQVRAGIPDDLDAVVCRALEIPGRHGAPPLRTPSELVEALATVQTTAPTPVIDPARAAHHETAAYPAPSDRTYEDHGAPRRRSDPTTWAWVLAALVLLVGLGLAGWQLAMTGLGGSGEQPTGPDTDKRTSNEAPVDERIEPLDVGAGDVMSFDPEGNGEENDDRAGLAVDGDRSTVWTTKTYLDPFGPTGLKDGVGLLLDLGEPTEVTEVVVRVQGGATDLEVRVAQAPGRDAGDFELFDRATGADGPATLRPDEPVEARYVLVWLTGLPDRGGSTYRGEISAIGLRGRPSS